MITSIHTLIYSDDAKATRAFPRDVLGWKYGRSGGVKSKFFNRSIRAAALRNAEALTHCAAIALCRPTGGGSQRETKKQASPIATKSSSKATKMSLTCNAAIKRRRIS